MPILLDFSQTVLSACYSFENELSLNNPDKEGAKSIVRHVILSQIKFWYNKFRYDYGKLIICCDGKHYWRKDIFKHYKACRKKARAQSNLDWKLIFEIMDQTIDDLREVFPYNVVRVDRAECDDIIATLTKYFQENEMIESNSLFDTPQKIVIISSDKDFLQLQKFKNVVQMSPMRKEFVKIDDANEFLRLKIITGDNGDGIPNVLSPDDAFTRDDFRSPKMTKKRKEYFLSRTPEMCEDEEVKAQWIRNRVLIDFDYIPDDIQYSILEEYKKPISGNKAKVFEYLMKNQCFQLMKEVDNF